VNIRSFKFIVLGGCGAIGRVVVRDLLASDRRCRVTVADYRPVCLVRSRRVRTMFADARAADLRGHDVVINCTHHHFNLHVMRAALRDGVHYVDLGGLFTWTRRQLKLHRAFQQAGLTAILGVGCAPGITNVMARALADRLGRARSVKIRVGSRDFHPTAGYPYSARTIREELTLPAWIFHNGRFRQVPPRTGWERVRFPPPVGWQWVVRTRHSEVATLPVSLGLRYCDFKVGFDRDFVRRVLRDEVPRQPVSRAQPDDYEVARVIVDGAVMDCLARAHPRWRASAGDVDTAWPASVVAQMIARGQLRQPGVWPPEVAVPVEPFFKQLRKRGLIIQ
jgi:saccharopine dehydrogenase-like NADP-dependent oxidoreductase